MLYQVSSSSITAPTVETLREYSSKMFGKIQKFIDQTKSEAVLRIYAEKQGNEFYLTIELHYKKQYVVKTTNRDLRQAVKKASQDLKAILLKDIDKRHR